MPIFLEQKNHFKEKLLEEKKNLEEELAELKSELDFGDDVDGLEEETDEAEEFATQIQIKKALEHRLLRIEKALKKIQDDIYGSCEKCGAEISATLLEVDPESQLCRQCKISQER